LSPEETETLVRWGYEWFNREKAPPPTWLPDGEYINAREDPDHATYRGIDAIRRQHQGWVDAYPDLRVEPLEIRVNATLDGDRTRRIEELFDRSEALEAAGLNTD
jgi:hypothetical protein